MHKFSHPGSLSAAPYPSAEYRLITSLRPYFNFHSSRRYPVGPGDDAAVRTSAAGEHIVLTTDCMVEGTHFTFEFMRPEEIGWKATAANVSDCAAMGARPESVLVDLVFSGKHPHPTIRRIYRGIYCACRTWGLSVVGGNLSSGPCWVVSLAMVGRLDRGMRAVLRSGARSGDLVWVSGRPGESAAGLALIRRWGRPKAQRQAPDLVRQHVRPGPDVGIALALARDPRVHAMVDISDGVAKEARTVAYESGVRMVLQPDSFPVGHSMRDTAKRLGVDPIDWFLAGGEDYGLLFTAASSFRPRHLPGCRADDFAVIGRVVKGRGVVVDSRTKHRISLGGCGWDHLPRETLP